MYVASLDIGKVGHGILGQVSPDIQEGIVFFDQKLPKVGMQ